MLRAPTRNLLTYLLTFLFDADAHLLHLRIWALLLLLLLLTMLCSASVFSPSVLPPINFLDEVFQKSEHAHTDTQTDATKYITVPHLRVVQFLLQSTQLSSNRMSMSCTNNRTFTISDSHKDEIKLIAHGNHMVTTRSVISMAAHTNLHSQLECKLLQTLV